MPAPGRLRHGLRLAVATLTVIPVPAGRVDRDIAGVAMRAAPAIGIAIGAAIGLLSVGLRAARAPWLLIGFIATGAAAGLTRGLHLDGLADTVDALGSYQDRDRALAIMKSPDVGPFGVVAIILAVAVPATAIGAMLGRPWWSVVAAVAAAAGTGRAAITDACRRPIPAARPDGLGAMVAGTTGPAAIAVAAMLIASVAIAADPDRWWQGPASVLAGLAAASVVRAHTIRRFGGITGDVLGSLVEVASMVTFVGLVLGS